MKRSLLLFAALTLGACERDPATAPLSDPEVLPALDQRHADEEDDSDETTGDFLVHLATHLAYHLGQIDYHRRVVTGERRSINAIAVTELPVRDHERAG